MPASRDTAATTLEPSALGTAGAGEMDTGAVDRDGVALLLEAILADRPKLDGATCRGRHQLFDTIAVRGRGHRYRDRHQARVELAAGVRAVNFRTAASLDPATAGTSFLSGTGVLKDRRPQYSGLGVSRWEMIPLARKGELGE